MQLPYELVRTLAVVSDTGTLDAASRALQITASAVSQRVKSLEEYVGRALLVRSKPVRLTEAGRTIVEYAHRAAVLEEQAMRTLGLADDSAALPELTVRLDTGLSRVWISAVSRAASEVPAVVTIHDDDTGSAPTADQVMSAALTTCADSPAGWVSVPLGQCQRVAVASPELLRRAAGSDHRFATPAGIVRRGNEELHSAYSRLVNDGDNTPLVVVDSECAVLEAVVAGAGWALVVQPAAAPLIASRELVAVHPAPGPVVEYYWHRWNVTTPLLDAMTAQIVAAAGTVLDPVSRYQRDGL